MSTANDFRGPDERPGRTLGEAANRYVTFQIVMSVIGLVLFLIFLFAFFLPMWNAFPRPW